MHHAKRTHEHERLPISRNEIVERMLRILPEDGFKEVLPGLFFARSSKSIEAQSVYQPAFCFVAQGSKRAFVGEEIFRYDPGNYLIFTVDLPIIFKVDEASKERPYVGLALNLDPTLVGSVMIESGIQMNKADATVKAMNVSSVDADLLDAIVRLIRLLETPDDQKVLGPMIMKEITYRLLRGGQGARLSHLLDYTGDTQRISKAIRHLREHLREPLKIESIARELGMSISGFHHHFKSVTAMSPLQFQKHLRLQEARRLMMGEDLDAASAGFRVGYEDRSYFSRDYKKMFGAPPMRDIATLRRNMV